MKHSLLARLLLITGSTLPAVAACESSQEDSNTAQTSSNNGGSSQAGTSGEAGSGTSGQGGSGLAGSGGGVAGQGGSDTAGSGGSDAAGSGGSDAAGSGGSTMAGAGGSDTAGAAGEAGAGGSGGSDAGAGGSAGEGGSGGTGGSSGVPCVEGGACVEDSWCGDANTLQIKHCTNGAYQSASESFIELKVCIDKGSGECLKPEDIELYPAVSAEYNASCLGIQGPSTPQVQAASNGIERCCYQVFAVCVGRPLFLEGEMRLATLRSDALWG